MKKSRFTISVRFNKIVNNFTQSILIINFINKKLDLNQMEQVNGASQRQCAATDFAIGVGGILIAFGLIGSAVNNADCF